MTWRVKGILFLDYVRMIRGKKDVNWGILLEPEDLPFLAAKIDLKAWYPMETFERMGNAILKEIAHFDLDAVRAWGMLQLEQLRSEQPMLLAPNDPVETLMRFRVHRATFFDFDTLSIPTLTIDHAHVVIGYNMGAMAEEAASHQTMGFFEALLAAAGARDVRARFLQRAWDGAQSTILELEWS